MQPTDTERSSGDEHGVRSVVQDRVLAIVLVVATSFFWFEASDIMAAEARMFPLMILSGLYVLSALLALRTFRLPAEHRGEALFSAPLAFLSFVGMSAVYVASVGIVGFFTATAMYMPIVAWLLGLRRIVHSIVVTAVFLIATYIVFVVLFARPMPREILWG